MVDATNRQLLRHISRWDRRLRLTQLSLWVPRGLAFGLLIGLIVALLSRVRTWLLPPQIATVTGLAVVAGAILALVVVLLWPRPTIRSARYFDQLFGLKERSSTALELSSGTISAPEQLVSLQIQDALSTASKVEARRYLRLQWQRRELALIVVMVGALALALLIANPQASVVSANNAVQAPVAQQVKQGQQQQQALQNKPPLSEADKQKLNKNLENTIK